MSNPQKNHINSECQNVVSRCQVCSKAFHSQASLRQHIMAKCQYYSVGNMAMSTKTRHNTQVKNMLICDNCPRKFISQAKLKTHNIAKCLHCNTCLNTAEKLVKHLAKKHFVTIKCEPCQQTFSTQDKLERHNRIRHIVKCEYCDDYLKSEELLSLHMCNKHKIVQDYERKCDAVLDIKDESLGHDVKLGRLLKPISEEKKDLNEFNLKQCLICKECFKTSDDLEKHSKVHIKIEEDFLLMEVEQIVEQI
ncbi:hypothetical protein ACFFRR_011532 [Megaselia abdita]